jgi:hypothetical protein
MLRSTATMYSNGYMCVTLRSEEGSQMTQHDLAELLTKAPRECWLALNEEQNKIVGRGETIKEAVEEARQNGVEDPIVMWAPKQWTLSVF